VSDWSEVHHRCPTPRKREVHQQAAGQGSKWTCPICGDRWRLVINVGRFSWLNLRTEDKHWIGIV
jgi:hypothetical protein